MRTENVRQGTPGLGRLILFCCALGAGCASAQSYPSRPIRMLIPQPAGGTMDTVARMVAHEITPVLGQNIVIDNRTGANGIIAGETLARAAPDGYTLLYTSASLANNQLVHKKLPFDALRDFAPVTQVTTLPGYLILVNPQLPAKTLKDLIELSKKTRVHFGSSGHGNSQHLLGELINSRAGARMVHVPYKGFALIINGLMGNEIQVAFGAPVTVVPHIKAGRLRAIAYTGDTRWNGMPELPTAAESGMPGFSYEASWHGLFAPAATPKAIVSRLQTEIRKAVLDPRMRAKLESGGHVPIGSPPAEFAKFLKGYFKDTAEQLRIANVQPQ
jgi:tripartite-type tricarboxylate transporter receptor subunit TctC